MKAFAFIGLLFILLIISFLAVKRFTLVKVEGISMLPTYKDGKLLLLDREQSPYHDVFFSMRDSNVGECYVIINPLTNSYNIKRLIHVEKMETGAYMYWFEGDNKENSIDSRTYGFVSQEYIVGKIIPFSRFFRNLLTTFFRI